MNPVVIPKKIIRDFIDNIKSMYRVVAPVKKDGLLEFNEISSSKEVQFTDEIPYKSPKEFLFPHVERFLRFFENGEIIEENLSQKTLIFGVKPCDLEAIKILTAVFTKGKFTDTLFKEHIDNTLFIGLGCIDEKPGCFCSNRGIDKNYSKECDIFLKDKGEYYIAYVQSQKGENLIRDFLPGYIDSKDYSVQEEDKPKSNHQKEIIELNMDENILFNNVNWEEISEICMGCGTCTYICPTCHCFEFKDVPEKGCISRYRCWDSCMYPKFTLHTSGHNPRPSKKERYRQRVMHKYLYVKKNFGYTACTGCGRCIRSCPAGMNIKSVVKRIMEELT